MAAQLTGSKTACVIGGTGFVASLLVKLLLEEGYAVNTTVRDPDNQKKISHLVALQSCDLVFHVATPVNFASEDPENDMIKPAVQGALNVLKASAKAETVKRVILTSSAAAVTISSGEETGLVVDESNWTDVEATLPPRLAEKAAWKFAEENGIDLITVIPSLMAGPSLTSDIPSSVSLAMSLITGKEFLINGLKGMQMLSGSISISHVEDVCRAHIFVAEKESASGRYICCAVNKCT
ncbi:unnamed protein product [Ilex paraguariensis]|uniref:Dihydroflavonol 4-reductase n=1 Tax=Ilex paraguariensis TaxID=185542 RepID=A0ABC8QSB2_9AQUA